MRTIGSCTASGGARAQVGLAGGGSLAGLARLKLKGRRTADEGSLGLGFCGRKLKPRGQDPAFLFPRTPHVVETIGGSGAEKHDFRLGLESGNALTLRGGSGTQIEVLRNDTGILCRTKHRTSEKG